MFNFLVLYSGIITILMAAIWMQNNNLFKEIIRERQHSEELRKTILEYLKK